MMGRCGLHAMGRTQQNLLFSGAACRPTDGTARAVYAKADTPKRAIDVDLGAADPCLRPGEHDPCHVPIQHIFLAAHRCKSGAFHDHLNLLEYGLIR